MRQGIAILTLVVAGVLSWESSAAATGTPVPATPATATPAAHAAPPTASATATPKPQKPPVFLAWLKPDDPGDQVIRVYWKKVEAGTATPEELVDLGTMLFYRGYPKDAVRLFEQAVKMDDSMAEAWFRIGTVYHAQRKLTKARKAYHKCIKRFPGHGWCNFFLGLCDEQLGYTEEAVHYYRRAYRYAPELMDPDVNPAVLYSRIQAGARVPTLMERLVKSQLPLPYLEPQEVSKIRSQFEPTPTPTPTPTPRPVATKPPVQRRRPPHQAPTPRPAKAAPRSGTKAPVRPTPVVKAPPHKKLSPAERQELLQKLVPLSPGGMRPLSPREGPGAVQKPTPKPGG